MANHSLAVLLLGYVLLAPLFAAALILVPTILLLLLDMIVVEPFAWLLERPLLDKLIKSLSLVFLIVGFHFDLLAS